jgi:protein SCO1/2
MILRRLIVLILLTALAACSRGKQYEMRGQVLGVNQEKAEVLVDHEAIEGWMPAMTMSYTVSDPALLSGLQPGDLITARVSAAPDIRVTSVTKTGSAPLKTPPPAPTVRSEFELIKTGEEVPDQAFVDQDHRNRTLSDIRDGRALALTFIYTTCPMPTFCPLMDRHFVEVQNQIKAREPLRDQVRLLSVSFDPAVDTPEVLKGHARELGADPNVWTFVTGNRDDTDRFAMRLGLTLMRGQTADPKERAASVNQEIGHTLRTAVIDRNGTLVKVYTGNEWTPAQLVADLESLR